MIPAEGVRRRIAWALAAGAAAVTLLCLVFPPGVYDVPPLRLCGTAPIDETYWSAPIRERMGAGRMEDYDQGLALSLALPQNVAGVVAQALGAPVDVARHAGSLVAAFSLGFLAVFLGGLAGLALGALLFVPFVFGHLATDLGEGPAFAIVAWWLWAASRGRWALAAALAGLGVFQKGCGLFLGVGCLAAVVVAGPDRLRRLAWCAAGAGGAIALSALAAWAFFGDDPLRFVIRPWTTTAEVRPVPGADSSIGHLLQAAFASFHGAAQVLAPLLLAAALFAPRSRPSVPVLAALAGGLAFYALFPDPQRLLPLVPLLVLPAFPAAREIRPLERSRSGHLLALLVASQAAAATVGVFAPESRAWLLAAASLVLVGAAALLPRPRTVVALAAVAISLLLSWGSIDRHGQLRSTDLHELADVIAARVPADADLISSPVLGLRHRGTLWYIDFRDRWRDELARKKPARLFRIRAVVAFSSLPSAAAPPGYVPVGEPMGFGMARYAWDSAKRDVWLEEFRPGH